MKITLSVKNLMINGETIPYRMMPRNEIFTVGRYRRKNKNPGYIYMDELAGRKNMPCE